MIINFVTTYLIQSIDTGTTRTPQSWFKILSQIISEFFNVDFILDISMGKKISSICKFSVENISTLGGQSANFIKILKKTIKKNKKNSNCCHQSIFFTR